VRVFVKLDVGCHVGCDYLFTLLFDRVLVTKEPHLIDFYYW